jgi:predicted nucleic-acid-binding protein
MNIIVDTNVLIRFLIESEKDKKQNKIAADWFEKAKEIIIPTHVFCEFVWVLSAVYKISNERILFFIEQLLNTKKIITKEDEILAGLALMQQGGDFADGVNQYTGHGLSRGSSVFISFDKQAVRLLTEYGISAIVPS